MLLSEETEMLKPLFTALSVRTQIKNSGTAAFAKRVGRLAGLASLLTGMFVAIAGAQTEPIWLDDLKKQILEQEACDANYFLNVHKYELAGDVVYEAKVQCVDGRQFDATRTGTLHLFVIRACQPVVC